MTKHVQLTIKITEYADDGNTHIRELRGDCSGFSDQQPWLNLQLHGQPLTASEVIGLNQVMTGFKKMLE